MAQTVDNNILSMYQLMNGSHIETFNNIECSHIVLNGYHWKNLTPFMVGMLGTHSKFKSPHHMLRMCWTTLELF